MARLDRRLSAKLEIRTALKLFFWELRPSALFQGLILRFSAPQLLLVALTDRS